MKYRRTPQPERIQPDMTPMIDCVFQLVVFFLLTLNFATAEQSALIRLPTSELAKPSGEVIEYPITLQLVAPGKLDPNVREERVILGSDIVSIDKLPPLLQREKDDLMHYRNKSIEAATVIIRADANARHGKVQDLIDIAQKLGFVNFLLRAQEEYRPQRG